jgi:hypothetical protein
MGTEAVVYISTTPPANPYSGKLWYRSDQGKLFVYYSDVDSSQWVGVSAIGTTGFTGSASPGYTGSAGAGSSISSGDLFLGSMLLGGM